VLLGAAGVGLMFSLVTYCMYAAFRQGAPISVASPLIRLGGLVVASIAGALIWKEPLSMRYLAGLGLSVAGLYLIASK
jgi:drug/metabolite transporter (DMT)-like permease